MRDARHACWPGAAVKVSTAVNKPPNGVMPCAGKLWASARDTSAAETELSNYTTSENASSSEWMNVLKHFGKGEYAKLVARLRKDVEAHYPGE